MAETERRGFWRSLWRWIDGTRRAILNLLFVLVLVMIIAVALQEKKPAVPDSGALVVAPAGILTDQLSYVDPVTAWLSGEQHPSETLLSDAVESIDRAAGDPRISMMVLQLRDLYGGGLSKMQELAEALQRFRAQGKPIVAVGDLYTQDQYFLAAHADEILLNPMGAVLLEGYGVYRNYFRQALEKLAIDVNVFRVGEFKSAVEPFTRDDMSESARNANRAWLDDLWQQYRTAVAEQRQLTPEAVADYVDHYAEKLAADSGDAARAAMQAGLVDRLLSRPAVNDYLRQRAGAAEDGGFSGIDFRDYLAMTQPVVKTAPVVGEITASGMIVDGEQPPGTVGGDSLAALLRQARLDNNVKALVLRIDSGGGSAYASEVIRQELLALKRSGKPVVVSMGAVAASGGYWIAADADQIWATPATLTGSIGIFGALPTFDRSLQKLGVTTDGVATTALAGAFRLDRPLSESARAIIQQELERGYHRFIDLVAEGRRMPSERVESVAQGRVWSGVAARDIGLVDHLGGLLKARRAAAELAGLDNWRIQPIELPMSPQELLLRKLSGALTYFAPSVSAPEQRFFAGYRQVRKELSTLTDPRGFYLWCNSCIAP